MSELVIDRLPPEEATGRRFVRRNDISIASYPGSLSTNGSSRRRAIRAIRCSSGCGSCRSPTATSTNSTWCASPA